MSENSNPEPTFEACLAELSNHPHGKRLVVEDQVEMAINLYTAKMHLHCARELSAALDRLGMHLI